MNRAPANITAVVLAGGKGRRLHGRDKGLVEVAGKPLVSYVIERILPQVGEILISANRNTDEYEQLGYRVLGDSFGDYAGPMAGILTAMQVCETEYLLSIPCDCPCLPETLSEELVTATTDDLDIVTVHDSERLQPIIMLTRCNIAGELESWLGSGKRAVHDWVNEHAHKVVRISQPAAFQNLNTDEDLEAFAQVLCT